MSFGLKVHACSKPSKYNICFTAGDGYPGTYMWDQGDGPQPPTTLLRLTADESYVMEISGLHLTLSLTCVRHASVRI